MKYKTYEEVPWFRREPGALVFLLAIFCCSPIIVAICIIALTGDVYKNGYDKEGNLVVWGIGNKIAAVLILIIQTAIYVVVFALQYHLI
jgi:hypothetical protein